MGDCSSGDCSTCSNGDCKNRLPPKMLEIYDIDMDISEGLMVFVETEKTDGETFIIQSSKNLLGHARSITSDRVFGILFAGAEGRGLYDEIFSYGVDTLYHMRSSQCKEYHPMSYAKAIVDAAERMHPKILLFPATEKGKELASIISELTGAEFTPDLPNLVPEDVSSKRNASAKTLRVVTVQSDSLALPATEKGRKGTAIIIPYSKAGIDE